MECSDLSPKKRKIEPTTNEDYNKFQNINGISTSNKSNQDKVLAKAFLTRFLDRLRLKTIPHILPLLERLSEAENKNVAALKSIDKINKRIKELEFHVEKGIKTGSTSSSGQGTDLTDNISEEFMIIMNALQSSPFTPFKPPTSQAFRQNEAASKQNYVIQPPKAVCPLKNGHSIDLSAEINKTNGVKQQNVVMQVLQNKMKSNLLKLDVMSASFLPVSNVTNLMSNPRLTWDLAPDGICLQWNITFIDPSISPLRYEISSFQKSEITLNNFPWRKIGEVAALPLPMACTLTYVAKMNTYFFAIRAWIKDDVASSWSNVIMVEIN